VGSVYINLFLPEPTKMQKKKSSFFHRMRNLEPTNIHAKKKNHATIFLFSI